MPEAWSIPRTWTNGEVPGETEMNTHVRDNLRFLKDPSFQQIITASGGTLSTTATTAVPISTADLSITLTTYGGAIHGVFHATFSAQGALILGLDYDGTAVYNALTGVSYHQMAGVTNRSLGFNVWITGLASGSHTFRPTWRVGAGTNTGQLLLASAPAFFWVREG
jgi:hypothetical protein